MATKQTNSNSAIAQGVTKAASVAIQVMTVAEAKISQNVGPILGGTILKQLTFIGNSADKYTELRHFR